MAAFTLQSKQPCVDIRFCVATDAISSRIDKLLILMAIFTSNVGVLSIQNKKLVVLEIRQPSGSIVARYALGTKLLLMFSHKNGFIIMMASNTLLSLKTKTMIA